MVESDNTEVGPISLNDTTDKNIKSNLTKKALRNIRFALPKHSHPLKLINPQLACAWDADGLETTENALQQELILPDTRGKHQNIT